MIEGKKMLKYHSVSHFSIDFKLKEIDGEGWIETWDSFDFQLKDMDGEAWIGNGEIPLISNWKIWIMKNE